MPHPIARELGLSRLALPPLPDAAAAAEPTPLRPGRLHEVAGPAARAFAAIQAGLRAGPVLWILPPSAEERPDGFGLAAFFDPARLILVDTIAPIDVFWALEEALRSGAAPLVIAETTEPPGLAPSRRLQLAAEAGGGTGLLRIPERALATNDAAETRWRAGGLPGPLEDDACSILGRSRWRWDCRKNKRGRPGAWRVDWDGRRLRSEPQPPDRAANFPDRMASAGRDRL